jgi:energy-coupling factor transport system substrate-specific component
MKELRLMWQDTRMVVLCAISAALYAAVLIPFKVVPLVPGVTEMRPANAIPVVCSFLFGPAAAWGSAIGNLIGDFFGGAGPGDFFGFFGNLAYGFLPYKIWQTIGGAHSPLERSAAAATKYFFACLAASMLCADVVGWGDNLLGLRPFAVLGNLIVLNNMLAALVLAPFLLAAVYPRASAGRLLYGDIMPRRPLAPRGIRLCGLALLFAGELGAWAAGNLISAGYWTPGFLPRAMVRAPYSGAVGAVVTPPLALAVLGMFLL